jgi:hypothetical protein
MTKLVDVRAIQLEQVGISKLLRVCWSRNVVAEFGRGIVHLPVRRIPRRPDYTGISAFHRDLIVAVLSNEGTLAGRGHVLLPGAMASFPDRTLRSSAASVSGDVRPTKVDCGCFIFATFS